MTETSCSGLGASHTDNIHSTGITVLYAPSSPVVDICFAHGFTGHPVRTWRSKKRAMNTEPSAQKHSRRAKFGKFISRSHQDDPEPEFMYWPRDLLPGIIPRGRVLTFGYDTNIRHSLNGPISQNRLSDHATDFLSALGSYRSQDDRRPLIFVAHSLGGLLVKDTLRLSKSYEHAQPDLYRVYSSTRSLFFFGTPHAGADPCNTFHGVLLSIIKAVGFRANNEIVRTLMPGAERSKLLADDFLKMTSERDWEIYTFQEELVHSALGVKIVEDYSSCINDPQHERIVHIRADHVDMCRFTGADDPEFHKASSALLRAQERLAQEQLAQEKLARERLVNSVLSSEQRDKLLKKLNFHGIDARYMTLKKAQRKPGTGKSVSMKYLHDNSLSPENGRLVLKFFFNARGQKLEHSVEGLYRSLLWQLIRALPVSSLKSYALNQLSTLDNVTPWPVEALKEAFSSSLMSAACHEVYCFIDALDESAEEEIRDMIRFFEDIGEKVADGQLNIRVCFSSRHYPHITIHRGLQLILEDEDEHSSDIRDYIHSQLRIDHGRQEIEDEIFDRSSRIFLWAVLVIDILNRENDKGGDVSVRKRLQQIPRGLHDLFQDILTRDNDNMEEMILCIQCILFAKRPLRPEELYFAVQIGSDAEASTVWDKTSVPMKRINMFNLNASKGLAEVTKENPTVQFIHESVRDYLLRDGGLGKLLHSQQLQMNLSEAATHDTLKNICLRQILDGRLAQRLAENRSNRADMPFLQYAVAYILCHADSAQSQGSEQSDFLLKEFPRETWVKLDNQFQKHKIWHHKNEVSLLYLLAEQNLASLIHIHPRRHEGLLELNKAERFPSPILVAAISGNNEAVSALIFEAAAGVLAADRPQDLNKVEKDLLKIPRLESELSNQKNNPFYLLSLICSVGSVTLLDALWDQIVTVKTTPLIHKHINGIYRLHISATQILVAANVDRTNTLDNIRRPTSFDIDMCLIQRGAQVDTITFDGRTALMKAVEADALETVEFLLGKSANPNISGRYEYGAVPCLYLANSSTMMKSLIQNNASFPYGGRFSDPIKSIPSLVSALGELSADEIRHFLRGIPNAMVIVKVLLEFKDRVAAWTLLDRVLSIDGTTVTLKNIFGQFAPITDRFTSDLDALKLLSHVVHNGINAEDLSGRTPIAVAAGGGDHNLVEYLLKLGADPNLKGRSGQGAVTSVIESIILIGETDGQIKVLKALLQCPSVDINIQDGFGNTPLSQAAGSGNFAFVQLLLSHPAIDVNLQNTDGSTPLLSVVRLTDHGSIEHPLGDPHPRTVNALNTMRLLLSHPSIDTNLPDNDGITPLLWAAKHGDLDKMRLLLDDPRTDRKSKVILDYAKKNPDALNLLAGDTR
ncbi:hypothetical protein NUW58_g5388 [Xylaria curta]|uniref:Uncharacterized protein n=1 Tax=Xylaria curta TaxID=42375 RepID=A0ACC1P2B9_9PEZI|nr:hypothetical protein NUW58_g5388 [Xylaria curta]